jgi:hypothetical protein
MSLNTLNRYKYTRDSIAQAIKALKKGEPGPSFLRAHPKAFRAKGAKLYQGTRLVIVREDKESWLRDLLYQNKNNYPFGRDSLFHVLKKSYLGITKRDIEAFLNKQQVIVARRSRPNQEKREFVSRIRKAGILSGDLAHIRPEDLPTDYMPSKQATAKHTEYKPGVSMKNIWGGVRGDIYFYNLVDIYTGYLVTEVVFTKKKSVKNKKKKVIDGGAVARATKRMVPKMAKALGIPVTEVQFDAGTEFFESQEDLNKIGIKTRRMRSNAVVEQTNAKMQRIFYTLVEMKRAGFKATVLKAVDISNNTLNRRIKMTPTEAVKSLRLGQQVKKQRKPLKTPAGVKKRAFRKGTKVRALLEKRKKTKAGYKRYKGKHFGPVQTITQVFWFQGYPRYELDKQRKTKGGLSKLAWHDEVIRARDADKISNDLVASRNLVFDVAPKKKKVKQVGPKHAKRQSRTTFRVGQRVWYTHNKKRLDATVTGVDKQDKTADVRYNQGGWKVNLDVPFKDLRPHYGD